MGATSSQSSEDYQQDNWLTKKYSSAQQFEKNLEHIMKTQSANFGYIDIFKMKAKPHQYIMKKIYKNGTAVEIVELNQQKIHKHKNFATIDYIETSNRDTPCGYQQQIAVYYRYYNFNIQDAIHKKSKMGSNFREGDIYYVANTLLSVCKELNDRAYYQLLKTHKIYLSPQGFLRIYDYKEVWKKQSIRTSQSQCVNAFNQNKSWGECEFNPEQLQIQLKNKKSWKDTAVIDMNRNYLIDIGLVLLSMITLSNQREYLEETGFLNLKKINFILDSYSYKQSSNLALMTYRKLLKGLLLQKWDIIRAQTETQNIGKQYNLTNNYSLKIIKTEQRDECTTSRALSYDQVVHTPKIKSISKSHLVAAPINILNRQKRMSQFDANQR